MNASAESKTEARELPKPIASPPNPLQSEAQSLLGARIAKPDIQAEPSSLSFSNIYADNKCQSNRETNADKNFAFAESTPPSSPRTWTLAVSLTTTMPANGNEAKETAGAQNKMKEIISLAEQTRDKPVTIYVQAAEPVSISGGNRSASSPQRINTYRLENGQVTPVDSGPSRGMANDLESLLDRAGRRAGNGNLGMIIQSHGVANDGIFGDTGRVSLPELETKLRNGLNRNGRAELDLLNFDSCLMSNSSVVQTLQGEAKNIVASAETETVVNGADGQNLKATLSALLANPSMSAQQFADTSVALARRGANDDSGNKDLEASGTDTLASINVAGYKSFENGMNQLSNSLSQVANNPAGRAAIIEALDRVKPLGLGGAANPFAPQRKDVGLILNELERSIAAGKIADQSGTIRQDIAHLRQDLKEMIRQYHGENYRQYADMTGLTITVPKRELANLIEEARANSNIGQTIFLLESSIREKDPSQRAQTIKLLTPMLENLPKGENSIQLKQQLQIAQTASNNQEFIQRLNAIKATLEKMQIGPEGQREIQPELQRLRREKAQSLQRLSTTAPHGWSQLMQQIYQC